MEAATPADAKGQASEKREFDVTCCCAYLCCGKQILVLEPEEAELISTTCCSSAKKRLPYGQLGSVDHNICCCCHGFTSALSGMDQNGNSPALTPGFGCSVDLVQEIVEVLRARMKARGDTGNIVRAEQALKLMSHVSAKMDAVVAHWSLTTSAQQFNRETLFERKEYDMTSCCHKGCTCGGKQMLYMDPEEVRVETTTPCCCCIPTFAKSDSIRPYGQLGEVLQAKGCGCLASVGSSMGPMSPGWGCEEALVAEVAEELKLRQRARGAQGNIQRQEEINNLVMAQDARLTKVCQSEGADAPSLQAPETMTMPV
jgi:hypothetical protein